MDVQTAVGLFLLALSIGVYGSIIGAGGGFLMVAGLVLVFDLNGATAVGTSVVTTLAIQVTGAYTYTRKGLVERPVALWFVVGSMPVAFLSAIFVADRVPEDTFELIIGVLLLALAAFVVFVRRPELPEGSAVEPKRAALIGSGSLIGVLSGALGVGSGLVTVPLLGWLQRLPAHRAAATTTLIGSLSGLAAAVGHTAVGNPRWSFMPFLLTGAVVGGRVGSSSAGRLSAKTVLGLLAGGLVVAGLPLLIGAL
ncbi:MAG: sulfite exporter TauE/SafE family protein [Ilumatobacter sp.]|uniref:sulfite exporter TauE/SafE family protein n=1 Tax=Ilumatobacter sp. TaxID=1967498 RepID=UPI003C7550A3